MGWLLVLPAAPVELLVLVANVHKERSMLLGCHGNLELFFLSIFCSCYFYVTQLWLEKNRCWDVYELASCVRRVLSWRFYSSNFKYDRELIRATSIP